MVAGKKNATPSKLTKAAPPSSGSQVNPSASRKSNKSEGVAAKIPGPIKTVSSVSSSLGKNPKKSVQFKEGPVNKDSEGPSNVAEEELDLLSEEELERQAIEVQRRLELLKAKRAKADKEQVNLADLDKATEEYLSKSAPTKSASTALSSSRLSSKLKQGSKDKVNEIHEAILQNKGQEWVEQRKNRHGAAVQKSEQGKGSASITGGVSTPINSAEPSAAEKSAALDNERSDKISIPAPNSTPMEEENSPVSHKSIPVNENTVPSPVEPTSEKANISPVASEEHVIDDFLNSDFVSSPNNNTPTGLEEPTPAIPQSHVNQEEQAGDPELKELFDQADQAAEQEVDQRKTQKRALPSRLSRRISDKSAEPPSGIDSEEVEIVEPVSKKPKVQQPQQKKESKKGVTSKGKKKQKEEGVIVNDIWFNSEEASERWKLINDRKVIAEGILDESKWIIPEVTEQLKEAGLLQALKLTKPFSEQLIREFVVNIPEDFGNTESPNYGIVKVRRKSIHLSPMVINQFLLISPEATKPRISNWHEVAQILTNRKILKWSGLTLDSKPLTSFYSLLHSICIKNWMPVTHRNTLSKQMAGLIFHIGQGHKVNLGEYIFDQLANQFISKTPIHPIGHPSTVQQLIMLQAPEILNKAEALTPIKPFLSDWKLFHNDHYIDTAIPKPIKDALKYHAQGITKKGKPAKTAKASDSSTLFWLKKHLKSIEAVRKEIVSQIVLLELQQSDNVSAEESEPSDSDSEETS